jgi:hypothetical protein
MRIWLKLNGDKKCVIDEKDDEFFETLNLDEGNCSWEATNQAWVITKADLNECEKTTLRLSCKETFNGDPCFR